MYLSNFNNNEDLVQECAQYWITTYHLCKLFNQNHLTPRDINIKKYFSRIGHMGHTNNILRFDKD